jgi:signal transduction histidine kinase
MSVAPDRREPLKTAGQVQAPLAGAKGLGVWLAIYEPLILASTLTFGFLYWLYPAPALLQLLFAMSLLVFPTAHYGRRLARRGQVEAAVVWLSLGLWVIGLSVALCGPKLFPVALLLSVGAIILSVPYAGQRVLRRNVICSIGLSAVAAFLSMRPAIVALEPFPENYIDIMVGGYALIILSLYALVAWNSNDRLRESFDEMRAANQALAESERLLEKKVEDRTRELARQNENLALAQRDEALAREEAVAANRHKSAFLASMSHELRTPLNAVIGFSEVLLERVFGELNDKQDEYLGDIHSSGKHLLSLINDILDLSKIEAGRLDLSPSTFALPITIENAMILMRDRARRAGVELAQEIESEIDEMTADERKIKQMLINLLTNAVKFTGDGGSVTLRARCQGADVEISVIDTGVGIAEKDHGLIFEEFRQAGDGWAQSQEGTGLGLALTKRLVELHGGSIRVESELGQGSTFTLRIPMRVENSQDDPREGDPA